MKKDTRIIIGACVGFLLVACFLFARQQGGSTGQVEGLSAPESTAEAASSSPLPSEAAEETEPDTEQECVVYVCGAVKQPGIYRYYGQARVCDAVEAVGGFRKKADRTSVNLARTLEDGEQICVLTKAQAKKQAGQTETGLSGETSESTSADGLVNINTATADVLMTLPGIGEAKANAILEYREQNGSFSQIEDIMNVSGIKDGVYSQIKDFITV